MIIENKLVCDRCRTLVKGKRYLSLMASHKAHGKINTDVCIECLGNLLMMLHNHDIITSRDIVRYTKGTFTVKGKFK